MNRRESLALIAGATAAAAPAALFGSTGAIAQAQPTPARRFELRPLGYGYDALEPYIDTTTMLLHHDYHHAGYVNACNELVQRWPALGTQPKETILADLSKVPEDVRSGVRNNLGGDWNHTFFW